MYMTKTIGSESHNFQTLLSIHDARVNMECATLESQGFEILECEPALMQTGNQLMYMSTTICFETEKDEEREKYRK